jgi:hypothetical protein
MHNRPAVVALRASLTALADSTGAKPSPSEDELHKQVCSVVDDLRELGWPPERVIIAMKELANEAGLRPSTHLMTVNDSLGPKDAVLAKVVRWCIERYYFDVPRE